jgi:putative ABC transport system permease protein
VTVEQQISDSLSLHRFAVLLLLFFAFMALVLAAVGVYSVITYYVSQRTHDIGIRIALGAQTMNVLGPLLRRGLTLTAVGISVGLAAAFVLARVVMSMLYDAPAFDFKTFFLGAALLAAVTMLAVYIPARRATKVDPLTALRGE